MDSFPFSIRVTNIKSDSGTLVIEWVMETEDGEVSSYTQNAPQTFQKQN